MSISAAASACPIASTTTRRRIPKPTPRSSRAARAKLDCEIFLEPGRLIAGNAGVLVTTVIYVKRGGGEELRHRRRGMNDLIRPTLYDAHHEMRPYREAAPDGPRLVADVVGPVCESGDYLALARDMPEPRAGDLLAVLTAGAYGAVQAGTYNSRLLVPEVLVDGDRFAVVRPRPSYEELIGLDKLPPWLA